MIKYFVCCAAILISSTNTQYAASNGDNYNSPKSNKEQFNLKYPANNVDLAAILESMIIYRTMLDSGDVQLIPLRIENEQELKKTNTYERPLNLEDQNEEPVDSYPFQPEINYESNISKKRTHRTSEDDDDEEIQKRRNDEAREDEEATARENEEAREGVEAGKKLYYMLLSRRPAQLKSLGDIHYEIGLKKQQQQ